MRSTPPAFFVRVFQALTKPELQEFILGDLEERFFRDLEKEKPLLAQWNFALGTIKFLRPGILRSMDGHQKLNYYGMLKNDFKTSLRVIGREKMYSLINVLSLSSAFTISLLILWYASYELSYEDRNPNSPRIARITMDYLNGETLIDQDCETYHLLGPMIKEEMPLVEDFVRTYELDDFVVKVGSKYFRTPKTFAVDPSYFEIFDTPLIHGGKDDLFENPNEIVLTRSMALRLFGKENAVGETIEALDKPMTVVGIIEDSPPNTHLKIKQLMSYASMKERLGERSSAWDANDTYTYLLLESKESHDSFDKHLSTFSDRISAEGLIENERIITQPMADIHLYSDKSFETEKNGDATVVYFLIGIALLVIGIAIVNYINLSTSKSLDRAKEVGIRKVIGSTKGQLRTRFFVESLLINLIAVAVTLIAIFLSQKTFASLAELPTGLDIFGSLDFWISLTILLVTSTTLSGIFPAFVLASFQPLTVLRGKLSTNKSGVLLRKILVVFQFGIALFLLVQTLTATKQLVYMQEKDLGISAEQVVVMRAPPTYEDMQHFASFKEHLTQETSVQSISLSTCVPGLPTGAMGSTTGIYLSDAVERNSFNFYIYFSDANFFETMQLTVAAGDNFLADSENKLKIIVNEEACRLWGFQNSSEAVGKTVDMWGKKRTIIGVVENFHQTHVKSAMLPMIFLYGNFGDYVSVKVSGEDVSGQVQKLEAAFTNFFPNTEFDYFFLDSKFDEHFKSDQQLQTFFSILTGFALLITCLGLFGLASYTVSKKTKEIGIRKVLGASIGQVVTLISREFISIIAMAVLIALPITYWLIDSWLGRYAFRIDLDPWLFIVPAIGLVAIGGVTIFFRTIKAGAANPVHSLRDE